jgi:hypothetical protein
VALVGASAWRLLLDPVPADPSALPDRDRSSDSWREFAVWSNAVPVAELLDFRDVIVLQTFIEAAEGQEIRLAADSSVPATMWVNGRPLVEVTSPRLIRPSYGAAEEVNKIVRLEAGFNEVLLQVRPADDGTRPELHVYCSEPDRLRNGIVHLGRTRFPWD